MRAEYFRRRTNTSASFVVVVQYDSRSFRGRVGWRSWKAVVVLVIVRFVVVLVVVLLVLLLVLVLVLVLVLLLLLLVLVLLFALRMQWLPSDTCLSAMS